MIESDLSEKLLENLVELVLREMPQQGEKSTFLKSFFFVRHDDPNFCWHGVSKPTAALVCQGTKIIQRGQIQEIVSPGELVITTVDIPDSTGITNVDNTRPFLCIYFLLERQIFVELLGKMAWIPEADSMEESSTSISPASAEFLETISRTAVVSLNSEDSDILGPLLLKELHYLLLKCAAGSSLRHLYMRGTNDNRIIEATNFLKSNLDRQVSVEELARVVFMSVSSLHRHFRKVTGFSPLQYHKELRLYEAQRLMLMENERADAAAQAVGYESVTQFSREYKRKFGLPPHRAIAALRNKLS